MLHRQVRNDDVCFSGGSVMMVYVSVVGQG